MKQISLHIRHLLRAGRYPFALAAVITTTTTAALAQPAEAPPSEPIPEPAAPPAAEPPLAAQPAAPTPAPVAEPTPPPLPAPEPAPPPPPPVPVAQPPAEAPPPPPTPVLIPSGSFFTRYELRAGRDDLGLSAGRFVEGDAFFYRARLGLKLAPMDLGEGLSASAQFTPQASGKMAELGNTVADANLGLHEGYFRLQGSSLRLDVGRFEMDYGDALVIGNLGWHQTARSFEGGRVRVQPDPAGYYVDLFLTQVAEGHGSYTDPYGAGDNYFTGVYAGLGPMVAEGMDLDLYGFVQVQPATDDVPIPMDPDDATADRDSATELTVGARVKGKSGSIDYRAEAGFQVGSRLPQMSMMSQDVLAFHGDAELGISLADNLVRLAIEGLYASGNDPETADKNEGWNQLYPTAHKFLGLADVFGGRTNAMSGVAHVTVAPAADIKLQLDAHLFMRPQPAMAMGEDGYAGMEVDAQVAYTVGKGMGLNVLYCVFMPDEDMYPTDEVTHYLEAQWGYNF